MPQKSIIETDYPVLFTSYIHRLSPDEIFTEEIRALMTRVKGRDFYDLWYLVTIVARINKKLGKEKLRYYQLEEIKKEEILKRIRQFSEKDFILDVRPFIPFDEREKLKEFFDYYLEKKFNNLTSKK